MNSVLPDPQARARASLAQTFETLIGLPVHVRAAMDGKKLLPWLAQVIGYSHEWLRRGGLSGLKQTRIQAIVQRSVSQTMKEMEAAGWDEEDQRVFLADFPDDANGARGMYSQWMYALSHPRFCPLPHTVACAARLDDWLIDARAAVERDDLPGLVRAWTIYVEGLPAAWELKGQTDWRHLRNWSEVEVAWDSHFNLIAFELFAALDAEWSAVRLSDYAPQPVLWWMLPGFSSTRAGGAALWQTSNFYIQPVRRLLEWSHAVVTHRYRGRWPDAPAGRQAFAVATDSVESVIGRYYEGKQRMTLKAYSRLWDGLCHGIAGRRLPEAQLLPCPLPMAVAALTWDSLFVRKRTLKRGGLLDLNADMYVARWQAYRDAWGLRTPTGVVAWPAWMVPVGFKKD